MSVFITVELLCIDLLTAPCISAILSNILAPRYSTSEKGADVLRKTIGMATCLQNLIVACTLNTAIFWVLYTRIRGYVDHSI